MNALLEVKFFAADDDGRVVDYRAQMDGCQIVSVEVRKNWRFPYQPFTQRLVGDQLVALDEEFKRITN